MQTDTMLTPIGAVVNTLYQIQKKYNKQYCYPSRETIKRYLLQYYNLNLSIRTISRIISEIKKRGIFKVESRSPKVMWGRVTFLSNMYISTRKTYETIRGTLCNLLTPKQFLCGTKVSHNHSYKKRSDLIYAFNSPGGTQGGCKDPPVSPVEPPSTTEKPNWTTGKEILKSINVFISNIIEKKKR